MQSHCSVSSHEWAVALAFLVVIPEGDLLLSLPLPLPLLFWLSSPKGICCCPYRCPSFWLSFRSAAEESAVNGCCRAPLPSSQKSRFDRSCSQQYRERRTGEIRFSSVIARICPGWFEQAHKL
jgi:hypothetical protein